MAHYIMHQIIFVFGVLFALLLCGGAAITLNPLALACGFTCAACATFAVGLAVKP
jgi:hypothetical protein